VVQLDANSTLQDVFFMEMKWKMPGPAYVSFIGRFAKPISVNAKA
jgi:hypothetical protein